MQFISLTDPPTRSIRKWKATKGTSILSGRQDVAIPDLELEPLNYLFHKCTFRHTNLDLSLIIIYMVSKNQKSERQVKAKRKSIQVTFGNYQTDNTLRSFLKN